MVAVLRRRCLGYSRHATCPFWKGALRDEPKTAATRIACVASVSVGFPARSMHFSLFGGAKIRGKRNIFARSKSEKCFKLLQTLPRSLGFSGQRTTLRQTVESFVFNHFVHFVFTRYNSCERATLNTWKRTLDFVLVH